MNKEIFYNLGLNPNETKIYLLLLEKGELSPIDIVNEIKITRQNSYAVFASLEKKGLVKKDERHNKFKYMPESPEKLSEICHYKLRSLSDTNEHLDMAMPELLSFFNLAKDRPGISYFKGINGVKRLYEDTLTRKPKEILLILSEKKENSYLDLWLKRQYRPRRIAAKTLQREIVNSEELCRDQNLKERLWERKCAQMPSMPKNIDILIYDDNVTFINYSKKEPFGFTVDDKLVYLAISSMFETIWEQK